MADNQWLLNESFLRVFFCFGGLRGCVGEVGREKRGCFVGIMWKCGNVEMWKWGNELMGK